MSSMTVDGIFASIISPVSVEDFFSHHWEKEPLYVDRQERGFYDDWLTLQSLDAYFRSGHLSPNFLRVVKNGVDCEPGTWTKIEQRKNTGPYRIAVPDKLFSLLSQGATIIVNAAQTAIENLGLFSAGLEKELGIEVQTNVYLSPPRSRGFDPHFDSHDVLILQISGSKKWRLYGRPHVFPISDERLDPWDYEGKEPSRVFDLGPGDLLYLPRGTVHVANTESASSVHVTVALMFRYWFHLLEDMISIARREEVFRQALPHLRITPEEKSAFSVRFRQQLYELVESSDIKELLENRISRNDSGKTQTRLVSDLFKVDELKPGSIVMREIGSECTIDVNERNLAITFDHGVLSLPAFLSPTVESLMNSEPYAIRELRGPVTDAGKVDLVKKFVLAGLLRIVAV